MKLHHIIANAALLVSLNSFADIAAPPTPFNGSCYCQLSCPTAYVSNDPTNSNKTNGNYVIYFATTATKTAISDNGNSLCLAASQVDATTTSLGPSRITNAQAATLEFCTNGGAQVGACSTPSFCVASNIVCQALVNYKN